MKDNSFAIVNLTLASAVATNGTFTAAYPTGYSKGDFIEGLDHQMSVNQSILKVTTGFTISFGTTTVTITYLGTTTLAAGTDVSLQLDMPGRRNPAIGTKIATRVALAPLCRIELGAPITADADGFCASQDLTAAGVASIDTDSIGAIAAAALDGVLDVPRNVVAAWTGTAVLQINGTYE